jgi:chemotaxis protein CheD
MFEGGEKTNLIEYFLRPGFIFVPDRPAIISTVLGSCVSVCLYDRKLRRGGMNHFQLPLLPESTEATPRYGHVATVALVEMMLQQGSECPHLEAQIFGGAHDPLRCPRNIGGENVRVARRVLGRKGLRIVSEDTLGEKGRKIVFDTNTGDIAVLKVERLRAGDWFPYKEN